MNLPLKAISHTMIAFLALIPSCAFLESPEGKTISQITIHITEGDQNPERFNQAITSKENTPYSSSKVNRDIVTLYESGLADDVRVATKLRSNMVQLIFRLKPHPTSSPPLISGNTIFSDGRLLEISGLKKTKNISSWKAAGQKIEKYYYSNGYPNAKVTTKCPKLPGYFHFEIEESDSRNEK